MDFENFSGWVDLKNCPKTTACPRRGRGAGGEGARHPGNRTPRGEKNRCAALGLECPSYEKEIANRRAGCTAGMTRTDFRTLQLSHPQTPVCGSPDTSSGKNTQAAGRAWGRSFTPHPRPLSPARGEGCRAMISGSSPSYTGCNSPVSNRHLIRVHSCSFVVQKHHSIRLHSWFKHHSPRLSVRPTATTRTRRLPSAARLTPDHLRRRYLQSHNPATEGTTSRRHHRLAIVHPHTKIFLRLTRQ